MWDNMGFVMNVVNFWFPKLVHYVVVFLMYASVVEGNLIVNLHGLGLVVFAENVVTIHL